MAAAGWWAQHGPPLVTGVTLYALIVLIAVVLRVRGRWHR
jgi:hypothetical protein